MHRHPKSGLLFIVLTVTVLLYAKIHLQIFFPEFMLINVNYITLYDRQNRLRLA